MAGFDIDEFVGECLIAVEGPSPLPAVEDEVRRAVADPERFRDTVRLPLDPDDDGVRYRGPKLTVVESIFPAGFRTGLHDHRVAAVIGAWAGYEDNLLFRRSPSGLRPCGSRRLEPGDVLVLDDGAIHDVHAPTTAWTAGLHVYLGDLLAEQRSSWESPDSAESPFDGAPMVDSWLRAARATGLVESPASPQQTR